MKRFNQLTPEKVCSQCNYCNIENQAGKMCQDARVNKMRNYTGIRFTADGFDCAMPVTIDTHSKCSYGCLYCFSDNMSGHEQVQKMNIGQLSLKSIQNIFEGKVGKMGDNVRQALKYHDKKNGFSAPIQMGGVNDPCDNIERQQGWLLDFFDLVIKHQQPIRISTKGNLLKQKDYLDKMAKAPHLFWVAFSINTIDDDIAKKVDFMAPLPSQRLETIKALTKIGVKTSLRLRPIFPGLTDSTPNYPDKAYKVLIDRASECGVGAISYEVGFYPSVMPSQSHKDKWKKLQKVIGLPIEKIYKSFGTQACTRPSYLWTEDIMHSIKEVALSHGLSIGISDPVWKQLGETGNCCGIEPDDPVFGNWQRESATNRLLEARDGIRKELHVEDIVPKWAYNVQFANMCALGAGPTYKYKHKHRTWADHLIDTWNMTEKDRSPMNYFQGALQIKEILDNGNVVYEYKGLERKHKKSAFWKT